MKEGIFDIFRQTQELVREVTDGLINLRDGGNKLETTYAAQMSPDWVRRVVEKYHRPTDPTNIIIQKGKLILLKGGIDGYQTPPPPPAA